MEIKNDITKKCVNIFREIWSSSGGEKLPFMSKMDIAGEKDISNIIYGTFVPFFSSGVTARKAFYADAGLQNVAPEILNSRYLGKIKIDS